MKNQELRSSLIKSGIILVLCVFFIYSFASGDSGGVTGTIGSLFSRILISGRSIHRCCRECGVNVWNLFWNPLYV